MDINLFIEKFAQIFDETEASSLTPQTLFRELDEWSSLSVLGVIALCDEEFNKEISIEDLHKIQTIQELYDFVVD